MLCSFMIKYFRYILLGVCLWFSESFITCRANTTIGSLCVQNKEKPLAVEDTHPYLSWKMKSDKIGEKQLAYQIVVVRETDGAIVWDTKRVNSDISIVKYLGVALQPEMCYRWTVIVWDSSGRIHKESSTFETGLMNPNISAWKGATWIGTKQLYLDAARCNYFDLCTQMRIEKGEKASLIIGANDFRLLDKFQNIANMEGENYVRIEFDISDLDSKNGAKINIYRVGYDINDKRNKPFFTLSKRMFPETNINEILTSINKREEHLIQIHIESSNLSFWIDNKELKVSSKSNQINVGPWGNNHDYNTLPHLASIGFAAHPNSKVVYTNYTISYSGKSVDNIVFDTSNYEVFKNIPNVHIGKNTITVENKNSQYTIGYVDPSHGALPMLRTSFSLDPNKKVKKAKIYATAMGAYVLYLNGKRVGEDWFAPGNSQYREVIGYQTYDVTGMLQSQENALGAQLSPGWYIGYMTFQMPNYNFYGDHEALLARLVVTYDDGTTQEVITNPNTWKVFTKGPIRSGCFFHGEYYDANREELVERWTFPDYDDTQWERPDIISQRSWIHFAFMSRYDDMVRVRETLTAQKLIATHSSDEHTFIYDMGVNMVGVPSITIPAGWLKKGDRVILRYAEQIYPGMEGDDPYYIDTYGKKGKNIVGRPLYETMRAALVSDFYVAKDEDSVTIYPTTTYRGYRYVQITLPSHKGPLPLDNVKGVVLSSDNLPTGTYQAETINPETTRLVNQLFRNIQRSQLGNFFTLPTDCPQRNERMGWTGDAQAYARTATYNSNVYNFFRQWMVTLRADQGVGSDTEAPGGIGSTVPTYNQEDDTTFSDGTTWSAAICMVPWQLYIQYGNTQIIEENIEAMMAWLNGMDFYDFSSEYPYLSSKSTGLADWLAMDVNTPSDLVNNAIYIYMMEITSKMARAINRWDYAEILEKRHKLAKEEWNKVYVDPENGKTRSREKKLVHSQSSYATPLNFNCFSMSNLPLAEKYLKEIAVHPSLSGDAKDKYPDYTITTGFSGTPNILPALSRAGNIDEAYLMFMCKDFTSWLYPVTKGATSIWERWNGFEVAFGKENQNHMNSFNHFALGAVGQWMYEYQLGITSGYLLGKAGYKHFVLQPSAGIGYKSLSGSYESNYGKIESSWKADGKGCISTYRVVVPANTKATLYLPIENNIRIFGESLGVCFVGKSIHNNRRVATYELDSGTFLFKINKDNISVMSR